MQVILPAAGPYSASSLLAHLLPAVVVVVVEAVLQPPLTLLGSRTPDIDPSWYEVAYRGQGSNKKGGGRALGIQEVNR